MNSFSPHFSLPPSASFAGSFYFRKNNLDAIEEKNKEARHKKKLGLPSLEQYLDEEYQIKNGKGTIQIEGTDTKEKSSLKTYKKSYELPNGDFLIRYWTPSNNVGRSFDKRIQSALDGVQSNEKHLNFIYDPDNQPVEQIVQSQIKNGSLVKGKTWSIESGTSIPVELVADKYKPYVQQGLPFTKIVGLTKKRRHHFFNRTIKEKIIYIPDENTALMNQSAIALEISFFHDQDQKLHFQTYEAFDLFTGEKKASLISLERNSDSRVFLPEETERFNEIVVLLKDKFGIVPLPADEIQTLECPDKTLSESYWAEFDAQIHKNAIDDSDGEVEEDNFEGESDNASSGTSFSDSNKSINSNQQYARLNQRNLSLEADPNITYDFSHASLRGANLRGVRISSLEGADLRGGGNPVLKPLFQLRLLRAVKNIVKNILGMPQTKMPDETLLRKVKYNDNTRFSWWFDLKYPDKPAIGMINTDKQPVPTTPDA